MNENTIYLKSQGTAQPVTAAEKLLAVLMLLTAYLFIRCFIPGYYGFLGGMVTLFTVVFALAGALYFFKEGLAFTKESLYWLVMALALGGSYGIYVNQRLNVLLLPVLFAMLAYWVLCTAGARIGRGRFFLSDLFNAFLALPLFNYTREWQVFRRMGSGSSAGHALKAVLLGLALGVPVLLVVLYLLVQADAAFQAMLGRLFINVPQMLLEVLRLALALVLSGYFFGLFYGACKREKTILEAEALETGRQKRRKLPVVTGCTVLGLLCLVYFMFFAAQGGYYFSAFWGDLPGGGMTAAEYARRGFFELCQVSVINLVVMGAGQLFLREAEKTARVLLKGFNITLSVLTLLLIATALSKMFLYIERFGMTQLRIFTSWFMLLLALFFILQIIRQFRSFAVMKVCAVAAAVMVVLLSYADMDRMIAAYNLSAYDRGRLETLDMDTLAACGPAAVEPIKAFYEQTGDQEARELIAAYRWSDGAALLENTPLYGYSLEYSRAAALWKMDWEANR
ncbi:DUF4173 domain-containing protein [Eubacterium sp. 1001713B170207_170306_E7]|uniref:DUF4153 domain-containing protein n=1 Tax=Eubacterium sp. 1001713B170207_170306_E7 TaxID=2787097 RepID=UPI00189A300B|nr:DUF4173 domain-containing protein [Eubacterium sp. 1001713B170207_170306_E7]